MLNIKNLTASIEDKVIIKDLSLEAQKGTIHAIMGPNGSGKSTLAHTLAGHPLYHVDSGKAYLAKSDILNLSPDLRAKEGIFLAFQHPAIIEGVSVQNMLKTALEAISGKPVKSVLAFRKKLIKIAEQLDINPDMLRRSVNDGFSGGEKKRLEIIQMLTLKPKVAIFDEIDSGLDIDSIKIAAKGIERAVTDYGTTAIIITHYRRILDYLPVDKVHIMIKGEIVKSGDTNLINSLEKDGYKKLNFK